MSTQGVNITVQDGGLGQTPPGQGNTLVVIGCSDKGTVALPVVTTDPTVLTSTFGYGPMPQAAAFITARSGNPVIAIRATSQTAGSNTAVAAKSGNTGSSAVTLTGTPSDTYYGLVNVVTGGTRGTAGVQFTVSLDGGRSIYQTVNLGTATTYVIPNTGLTLNFGVGTFVALDQFAWKSTEPLWNDAGVSACITGLLATQDTFLDILVVGDATGSDVSAFDGYMTTAFNSRRFARMLTNARDAVWGGASTETEAVWISTIETDHLNDSSLRVGVSAGHYNAISPIDQVQYRRPLSWWAAQRDSSVAIQVDLGRVSDGALPEMAIPTTNTWFLATPSSLTADGFIYHDESVSPGLDNARFLTAWTLYGLPGVYIKNPNIMAPPGSDFNWLQHGHVIDVASTLSYLFFINQLSNSVRVNKTTGFILEVDAQALEGQMNAKLNDGLIAPGAVSDAKCVVSRTDNILSTSTLTTTIMITPLGYMKAINVTIKYTNPAIQTT